MQYRGFLKLTNKLKKQSKQIMTDSTVHKHQTKEKKSSQLALSKQGEHNARQDPQNTIQQTTNRTKHETKYAVVLKHLKPVTRLQFPQ